MFDRVRNTPLVLTLILINCANWFIETFLYYSVDYSLNESSLKLLFQVLTIIVINYSLLKCFVKHFSNS